MSITAKEIAKKLNISATAVSMALSGKPGVSLATRNLVVETAEKYGYDFSKISNKKKKKNLIYFIMYRTHNAILSYSPIFEDIIEGFNQTCESLGYKLKVVQFYEKREDLSLLLEELRVSDCAGIAILATEMLENTYNYFSNLRLPLILIDTYFEMVDCNRVLINNTQGAYKATEYLISRSGKQPGYLHSSYPLQNFSERFEGFKHALKDHGMFLSRSIIHSLSPSIEGAFTDMLDIINAHEPLAECYFADNDLIAIGVIKALKSQGYRIPEDIAIIGFDNTTESKIIEPALTTINIPRNYMGHLAADTLIKSIEKSIPHTSKIQVSTSLVKRFST